ncbi:MAG TPA: SRPBCC family protein [Lacunisphaera sp.]|nr:SRPBCC family protein [Lacunisphaera sp.]
MKVVLLVLAGFAGLLALVALIGAALPRRHVASRQASYRQTTSVLYQAVRDFAAQPQWRTGVRSVELLAPAEGRAGHREISRHGAITYRVQEDRPAERLVLAIADENLPFGGTWTYEFKPCAGGASVRITEDGFVKNPLFRFLARFAFGHAATIETYLRDLGRKFGESVQPQP